MAADKIKHNAQYPPFFFAAGTFSTREFEKHVFPLNYKRKKKKKTTLPLFEVQWKHKPSKITGNILSEVNKFLEDLMEMDFRNVAGNK